ncbi:MAG: hypothetical protein HQL47_08135 [Gammaproteobacteria bacterium]|nr:hypothetical protein [Gammaproteobacteria bacterium]
MESIQQARADLGRWYRELTRSLIDHPGHLPSGFAGSAQESAFGQWLAQRQAEQSGDAETLKLLGRLHNQLQREVNRLAQRQQQFIKSRLAHVGIERNYLQLDALLSRLDESGGNSE